MRLALCGHHDGARRWSTEYEDGRTFTALMLNFQDDYKKSRGYFTLLTFDPLFRSISVTTYSPFFDDYNYYSNPSKETFRIAVRIRPRTLNLTSTFFRERRTFLSLVSMLVPPYIWVLGSVASARF